MELGEIRVADCVELDGITAGRIDASFFSLSRYIQGIDYLCRTRQVFGRVGCYISSACPDSGERGDCFVARP